MLAVMPAHCRDGLDARELWQWLSVAHSIMKSMRVTPDYLMRAEFLDAIERLIAIKPARRIDRRRMLRQVIRWLRQQRCRQGGNPRPSRLLAAIGLPGPRLTELSFCFDLPNGWRRNSFTPGCRSAGRGGDATLLGALCEGGDAETSHAYALRSSDGSERATLLLEPIDDDELCATLAGPENQAVSIHAVHAMGTLLRIVSPMTTKIRLS